VKTCPACGARGADEADECRQCRGAWQADGSFDPDACFAGIGGHLRSEACEPVAYDPAATAAEARRRAGAGLHYGVVGLIVITCPSPSLR
jgi:hypothetical protein